MCSLIARLDEELTRERVRLANRMRQQLWRYYPQFLDAVDDDVAAPWALDLWRSLPTPRAGQRVREVTLTRVLKQHRIRRIDAATLRARLRAPAFKLAPGAAERLRHESVQAPRGAAWNSAPVSSAMPTGWRGHPTWTNRHRRRGVVAGSAPEHRAPRVSSGERVHRRYGRRQRPRRAPPGRTIARRPDPQGVGLERQPEAARPRPAHTVRPLGTLRG